jgi:hypothetical protein
VAWRAPGGPPTAEPGADTGPAAALTAAALISKMPTDAEPSGDELLRAWRSDFMAWLESLKEGAA